jgi:hypothetical protein
MTIVTLRTLRNLAAAAAFALAAGAVLAADGNGTSPAYEERSLLASDGTLYVVRAGSAMDLGLTGGSANPNDRLIAWSSRGTDGTVAQGLIADATNGDLKHNLQLSYDEPTGALILLWKEEVTILNVLRIGIFQNGAWTVRNLLPTLGFAHAYNPQILLSHPTVTTLDENGNSVSQTRTILSVIWWEEAQYSKARYAPIFLSEVTDASDVQVYDLPALIGNGGATSPGSYPASAYMYPSLQLEGIGGAILASFTDLSADRHYVVRIQYPDNLGKPGPNNPTWQRRRIPVVGVASDEPIPSDVPTVFESVKTVVGASYRPTLVWNTDQAVGYTRFDGRKWSSAITIPITDSMTAERAQRLVQEMATRN